MERILVLGATGLVGSRFNEILGSRFDLVTPSREEVNLFDTDKVDQFFANIHPLTVINFVAFTKVDEAEAEKGDKNGLAFRLNGLLPQILAAACNKSGSRLIHISTDYIFNGQKENGSYTETDEPSPLNWYGQTKLIGDQAILESNCDHTIARIEMPYTAHYAGKKDLARTFLEMLQTNQSITAVSDQRITPNYLDSLVEGLEILIKKPESGIFNLASTDWTTPYDFARLIARVFGIDDQLVTKTSFEEYQKKRPTPRPQYCWLDVSKFEESYGKGVLVSNKEGVERFKKQVDSGI